MKRFIRSLAAIVLALTMLISSASALTVEQALELLELYYVGTIPDEAYEAETVDELVETLGDPYTYYMTAEEYDSFLGAVENTVSLVGIGVSIQYTEGGIYVIEALKGGPALAAGVQAGDLIVAVDGVSCVPANESHRTMILGEEGADVTITVLRNGMTMNFVIQRAPVVVPNTEVTVLDNGAGYIACSSFGSDTAALIREGVETYNDAVDYWLVDMRGNSGGYTDAASDAIGVFAGPGFHIYLRDGQGFLYYYVYQEAQAATKPVVVLVDGNSASAAEAFAAGIRDLNAGLLVGSRTYGKGTAQVAFDKETNPELFAEDAFKLTAYRFYSSGGTTSDKVGVIPTLLVPDEMAYDVALAINAPLDLDIEGLLLIELDGYMMTLNCTNVSEPVLAALFEALPPGAGLWVYEEGQIQAVSVEEAAQRCGVTYESRWFEDVEGSLFAYEINTLATYDLIHGDGEGSFYPQSTLKRGEVCALLAKALGLEGSDRQQFSDVPADDPYAPYINALAEMGFVLGMGDGTFRPDQPVTQQEYYIMLARLARYLNYNIDFEADAVFDLEREEMAAKGFRSWACDSAVLMNQMDALLTVSGESAPADPILREEAAASLCAVLVRVGILPG